MNKIQNKLQNREMFQVNLMNDFTQNCENIQNGVVLGVFMLFRIFSCTQTITTSTYLHYCRFVLSCWKVLCLIMYF